MAIPYARRDTYQPSSRLSELILRRGEQEADAMRHQGAQSAQMFTNLGSIVANGLTNYTREREEAPRRAQEQKLRDLQLTEAESAVRDRAQQREREGQFSQTLGTGGGREAILRSLESDPDLYKRASEHFGRIDTAFKRTMGEVAAGIRTFQDSPAAAMAGIDDLIAKGFDERRMEQYRAQIQQNPQAVTQLVDALLRGSPDEEHQKLATPAADKLMERDPTKDLVNPTTGTVVAPGTPKPVEEKTYTVTVAGPGGGPVEKLVTAAELAKGIPAYREPRAPRAEPARFWVMRNGEPIRVSEEEYRAGDRPANTREQGRPVISGDANTITDLNSALDDLKTLRGEVATVSGSTGTKAAIGAALPNWVTEWTGRGATAKSKQAVIDRVKQVIGKALEGGVLRKEDEVKYAKILPVIGDVESVVKSKLDGLEKAITKKRLTFMDSLEDAGYDVSRYRERVAGAAGNQRIGRFDVTVEP